MSAALLPFVLTGGWLLADAVQPAAYSPARQTVSVLAGHAGTDRWIMTGALFLLGVCYLVTAAGLAGITRPARFALVVSGVASIGIAACPEPARGSTPQHLAFTALGEITIAVWPALLARRSSPSRLLGVGGCAAATSVSVALLVWLVVQTRHGSLLGAAERSAAPLQACWPLVVAVALRRADPPSPRCRRPPTMDDAPGRSHRPGPPARSAC